MTLLKLPLMAALALTTLPAEAKVQSFFAPNPNIRQTLLDTLDEAKDHLDVAMYSLGDKMVMAKLRDKAANNVKVRLLVNSGISAAGEADALEAAGVDVRFYNAPIMHHKIAIIDGPQNDTAAANTAALIAGSLNWVPIFYTTYDEDFLIIRDEAARIKAFQVEFNTLYDKAKDYPGAAHAAPSPALSTIAQPDTWFTSANLEPIARNGGWSFRPLSGNPANVASRLLAAIQSATSSIKIATTHFRRADLAEALLAKHKAGIKVEILLDGQEFGGNVATELLDDNLAKEGVAVHYKIYSKRWNISHAQQMHAKYLIIDEAHVFTGSYNWSENSELGSFENLLALDNAAEYVAQFNEIYHYRDGQLGAQIQEITSKAGQGPCNFDPIALSWDDVKSLWGSYAHGACGGRP